MSSPYSWLSKKMYDKIEMDNLFKYDPNIESFKRDFSRSLSKYSSSEYTDKMYIVKMVCNKRYIFVLVKYSDHHVLFAIDTNIPVDDFKIFDSDIIADETDECFKCSSFGLCNDCKQLGTVFIPTWDHTARQVRDIKAAKNRPNTLCTYTLNTRGPFELHCIQDSNESECVIISDNYIYLYKDGILDTHEYMYTIRNVQINSDVVQFFDEYDVCYTYTYSRFCETILEKSKDQPSVKKSKRTVKTYYDYTSCNKTRIDSKGNRYRLTNTESDIPSYMYIPDVNATDTFQSVCISDTLCVVQTYKTSIDYFRKMNI